MWLPRLPEVGGVEGDAVLVKEADVVCFQRQEFTPSMRKKLDDFFL